MPTRLSTPEFIALTAMLFATIAFSIDAMLPALPDIGAELSPTNVNRAQLIVASFVLGMGVGTFFTGPLSDAYGRKTVLLTGSVVYIVAAIFAWQSETLEGVLIARVFQGLGASGPRIVTMAIIRDLYSGRQMAKLMSFTLLVFSLVPAIAPSLGAVIIYYANWRAIFGAFVLFSVISSLWLALRQAETLPRERRIPMRLSAFRHALREAVSNQMFVLATLGQTMIFGILMSLISTTQQIYDITFGLAGSFPLWFAGSCVIAASASIVNAMLVMRLGMRFLISAALAVQLGISLVMLFVILGDLLVGQWYFAAWFFWSTSLFFMLGLTIGNLNALAMEPMGHIAGMAASIIGAVSTVLSLLIAVPVGLNFDGTPLNIALCAVGCTAVASLIMRRIARLERVAVDA